MRAAAIAMVMASHAADVFAAFWGARPPAWLSLAGVFGVELFFVLSGFLIGTLLAGIAAREGGPGTRDWAVFMVRRWMRTLPLYYAWMAVMAVAWKPVGGWWHHMGSYATLTQNLAWPMPADNWFGVSWSLAVEEWFYLLFSLPMLALARLDGGRRTAWVVALGFVAAGLVARATVPGSVDFGQDVYKVVLYRADAIAYGVIAALLARPGARAGDGRVPRSGAAHALRHPGLLLSVGVGMVLFVWGEVSGGLLALPALFYRSAFLSVLGVGYALCLPAALRLRPGAGRPARGAAMAVRWLSRHAYGLYIVHLTVLEVASWTVFVDGWPRPVAVAIGVGGSAGLAMLAWRLVERPMLALRPAQPGGQPRLAVPGREPVGIV